MNPFPLDCQPASHNAEKQGVPASHLCPPAGKSGFKLAIRRRPYILVVLAFLLMSSVAGRSQDTITKAWSVLQFGAVEKDKDKRSAAVQVLRLIENDPTATEMAVHALDDNEADVRTSAAGALGQMKAKSAIPKLEELARTDQEPSVVIASARSLVTLGDPFGYNVYYAVLTGEKKSGGSLLDEQKKMLHDPKKMAQLGVETGIGFIPFGGVGLTAFKTITKDDASPVRAAAAQILANDKDPITAKALVAAASDKSWIVRAAALDSISHRNDPTLASQIEPVLDDDKDIVRYTAAAAIIHLHDVGDAVATKPKKK